MSIFFDRFVSLCREMDETPNSLAKKIKIPSGSITAWKNGSMPRAETVNKLAAHFRVSTDYLLGLTDEVSPHFVRRTDLLRRRSISFSDLSKKTGISVYRLKRYFSEESMGSTDFLSEYPKIARSLGVSPQYLYGLTDQENDESDTDERFRDWVMGHLNYENKKEPTPVTGDGLSEEQQEILNLFDSAPQALRAAALAVLRSAEGQNKAPGGSSTGE